MRKLPIFIPTDQTVQLVKPYDLKDTLLTLKTVGLIAGFKIGENLTRIDGADDKKFEISSFFAEAAEFRTGPKKRDQDGFQETANGGSKRRGG